MNLYASLHQFKIEFLIEIARADQSVAETIERALANKQNEANDAAQQDLRPDLLD